MKLGLYIDGAFRGGDAPGAPVHSGAELLGFMSFACAVGDRFDRFLLIARGTGDAAATPYPLPGRVELLALPGYPSLRRLGRVAAALPATVASMWRALGDLDAVWVSGVHPIGLLFAWMAIVRRRRTVLLIRQDSLAYFRSRLPGGVWTPLLAPIWLVELCFRLLARRRPTTVVGEQIAARYGGERPNLLRMRVSVLHRADLADEPSRVEWGPRVPLLTVGRIAPEKSPATLARALGLLDAEEPGRYDLTWVGEGPLAESLREEAAEQGVADHLELAGFVPPGEGLLDRYRSSAALVHTATTEGVPGVLNEALGLGVPVVATDVGGIRAALDDGRAGLLVPPQDPAALAAAIRRLAREPELRRSLAGRGLELARRATVEEESSRVAEFISGEPAA